MVDVPDALTPATAPSGPDQSIFLHRGPAIVNAAGGRAGPVTGNVSITLEWRPSVGVRFRFLPLTGDIFALDPVDSDDLSLTLPDLAASAPCQIFDQTHTVFVGTGKEGDVWTGVLEPLEIGTGDRLQELRFNVVNFGRSGGTPIRFRADRVGPGRRLMEGFGWRVIVDAVDEQHWPGVGAGREVPGRYAVTHVGSLTRADRTAFAAGDAAPIVDALTYLLSFCRGRHCGIGPVVGLDASGNRCWQRWSIGKIQALVAKEHSQSWFPPYAANAAERVFPGLFQKWADPAWQEVLRLGVDLYVTANTQDSSQVSLTIAQSLLELLSWAVLVEHRGLVLGDWDRVWASDRLRLLLSFAQIPIGIPPCLGDLARVMRQRNWVDGPHVVTDLRNIVIHPTKKRRDDFMSGDLPWEEAARLALWYGELTILRLCGYHGRYMNRLSAAEGNVPWPEHAATPLA